MLKTHKLNHFIMDNVQKYFRKEFKIQFQFVSIVILKYLASMLNIKMSLIINNVLTKCLEKIDLIVCNSKFIELLLSTILKFILHTQLIIIIIWI